jgi:hypothetical protein
LAPRFDAKEVAVATLEWRGQTFSSLGAETRREFAEKNKIALSRPWRHGSGPAGMARDCPHACA